jgi:cobalt/nickel transport protein
MSARSNFWLFLGVVLLALLPFWIVPSPGTEDEAAQSFLGADGKAMGLIAEISPDYRPWFEPLIEPSSSEIASLLFSSQAALGAGVIGYYIGAARTREKMRREGGAFDASSKETGAPPRAAPGAESVPSEFGRPQKAESDCAD